MADRCEAKGNLASAAECTWQKRVLHFFTIAGPGVWPCLPILTVGRLFKIHRGESIAIVTLASRYTPSPARLNCLIFCRIHPVQLFRVFSRPDPRVRVLKWDFLISMPGGGIGDFIAIERIGRRSYRAALAGTHGETRGSHTQGLAVD